MKSWKFIIINLVPQSEGLVYLFLALLSERDFWIQGIASASFGFRRFSGFHSKHAFMNSIRSGSFIFNASAKDLELG
jgi:hypothetical protein